MISDMNSITAAEKKWMSQLHDIPFAVWQQMVIDEPGSLRMQHLMCMEFHNEYKYSLQAGFLMQPSVCIQLLIAIISMLVTISSLSIQLCVISMLVTDIMKFPNVPDYDNVNNSTLLTGVAATCILILSVNVIITIILWIYVIKNHASGGLSHSQYLWRLLTVNVIESLLLTIILFTSASNPGNFYAKDEFYKYMGMYITFGSILLWLTNKFPAKAPIFNYNFPPVTHLTRITST